MLRHRLLVHRLASGLSAPPAWCAFDAESLASFALTDAASPAAPHAFGALQTIHQSPVGIFSQGVKADLWASRIGVDPSHSEGGRASALLIDALHRVTRCSKRHYCTLDPCHPDRDRKRFKR